MLDETYHCDGPGCDKTTPKARPSPAWKVVLWLTSHLDSDGMHPTRDDREWHYCSRECEHNATSPDGPNVEQNIREPELCDELEIKGDGTTFICKEPRNHDYPHNFVVYDDPKPHPYTQIRKET